MIAILIQLIIIAIVLGLIVWLTTQVPFIAPYANIIRVVALCLFVIWLLYILMGLTGHVPILR